MAVTRLRGRSYTVSVQVQGLDQLTCLPEGYLGEASGWATLWLGIAESGNSLSCGVGGSSASAGTANKSTPSKRSRHLSFSI